MPLANVALTDTYDTWRVRTNQIIIAVDQANTLAYSGIANAASGFNRANTANVLAFNTSIGANTWANGVGAAANSYAATIVSGSSNTWANGVGAAANSRSSTIGSSINNFVVLVGTSSNSYTDTVVATVTGSGAANSYANTIGVRSNTWSNTIALSVNNYTLSALSFANSYADIIGSRSNTWANTIGNSANNYANYVGVSSNGFTSVVGSAANTISNSKLANTPGVTFAGSLYFPTDATIFTSTGTGSAYIINNQINSGYNYNGFDGTGLAINFRGFNNGTTQFRNLYVYDGKTNTTAIFNGPDKGLYVYGDVQAYYASDASLKENVTVITDALTKVNSIRGVEFDWTDEHLSERGSIDEYFNRKHDVGVIAQEIEKILPEAVSIRENGIRAVKYDRIVPLLIEAIKDLSKQIDELKRDK